MEQLNSIHVETVLLKNHTIDRHRRLRGATVLVALLVALTSIRALRSRDQDKDEEPAPAPVPIRRPINPSDYGKWESLGFSSALSSDGRWLAYQIRRVNGKNELRLRMLATESKKVFAEASRPAFSADNNWLAFLIGVDEQEREKRQKAGQPVESTLGLHSLVTGKTTRITRVASLRFSDDGKYLVMRRYPGKGRESKGVDIVLRDLASGVDTGFGNVASYAWNDDGTLLAMVIDAEDKSGNGVQLFDAKSGAARDRAR